MSTRVLTILEVSQKQAYIFASNKLRDNITNSAEIAWVLDPEYFSDKTADTVFSEEENLVYAGGGHTVLTFSARGQAVEFTKQITLQIHKEYPRIEVFAKTIDYDDAKTPGENLKELTRQLERKKSVRRSAFHQGSFGIEKIDTNTQEPVAVRGDEKAENSEQANEKNISDAEKKMDKKLLEKLNGYKRVNEFSRLGGSKNESNFIAVVHIDGNAMGKRVENLYQKNQDADWDTYRRKMRRFSESIDKQFKEAYIDMVEVVVKNLKGKKLEQLDLRQNDFPVRRVITAGDDICFVAEGRIGIECARVFIEALGKKKNEEDEEGYAACAGVAIVHQKYPFYRAYELAEMLCSNAKKTGASLSPDGSGKEVSAIDWHIEFGEVGDTLEEIRASYMTVDGESLINRPYIISAPDEILKNKLALERQYAKFRSAHRKLQSGENAYAKGKIKELRRVLKQGKKETEYFLKFNKIEELGQQVEPARLFEMIELLDTFIPLD